MNVRFSVPNERFYLTYEELKQGQQVGPEIRQTVFILPMRN
ncbi:hypothetical protein B4110_0338 [Parageobacillus toebii]|uniref:Uncharacterized protein n=1 Tax=Parageobacillus toebii TaxID=153151 RepID=A0A150N6X7_9BACL|nr:hypothetical protein B4110_0338 [Parageobacillus toebii]